MIEKHFDKIERAIKNNFLVIFSDFQKVYTSQSSAYLRGKVRFLDNSYLSLFHYVYFKDDKYSIDYRYHYMDPENKMIFRYDNAPHYPNINTFPNHKHTLTEVKESTMPSVEDLMNEINQYIIKGMVSDK